MVYKSRTANSEVESLRLSLVAHKSLISEYALRAKQAEEAVRLLTNSWSPENVKAFSDLVASHIKDRSNERAVHQRAMLETLEVSLSLCSQFDDVPTLKTHVNNMHKELVRFLGTLQALR